MTDQSATKKLRILSIDGGGVRGVIPATILKYLEKELQNKDGEERRLADYFDLIVGTSTGDLIAAMITTTPPGDDPKKLPLSAAEVVDFYEENAAKIFPPGGPFDFTRPFLEAAKDLKDLMRPRYKPKELDVLLEKYCGNRTLSEALTNVIIPSFDIERQQPVFFSSWERRLKAALVKDVCLATSAAPTFLPPVNFTVPPTEVNEKKLEFNMIDGGIAANNPADVGITEAQRYWNRSEVPNQKPRPCLVLSLGTGRHERGYSADDAEKWGVVSWLRHHHDAPLISSLENASADMVDYKVSTRFEDNSSEDYLRIQVTLPSGLSKMDDSDNVTQLKAEAEKLVSDNSDKTVSKIKIVNGLFETTDTHELIRSALKRFAENLSKMREDPPTVWRA